MNPRRRCIPALTRLLSGCVVVIGWQLATASELKQAWTSLWIRDTEPENGVFLRTLNALMTNDSAALSRLLARNLWLWYYRGRSTYWFTFSLPTRSLVIAGLCSASAFDSAALQNESASVLVHPDLMTHTFAGRNSDPVTVATLEELLHAVKGDASSPLFCPAVLLRASESGLL